MKLLPLLLWCAGLSSGLAGNSLSLQVTPERELIDRRGSREIILQVEIKGRPPEKAPRSPMNLALVLDRSGSMAGAKLEKAKQAAQVALTQLDENDSVALIVYDNQSEVLFSSQRLDSQTARDSLARRIEQIRPGGGTAIHAGVSLGAEQLREHMDRERLNRVILLSDGIANVGPSRTSDLADLGRHLRDKGISVTTIGLGDDYNEDLMAALAEASQANYYYVKDAEKLPSIFAQELGIARTILARTVSIRITVPPGVRIQEILDHPEISCKGQSAEISLPEYFATDQRRFLTRCSFESPAQDTLELASVDLSYLDCGTGKSDNQNQTTKVKVTDEPEKSTASLNPKVGKDIATWKNRNAKELAVKLADEGKTQQAVAVLRSQVAANAAAPAAARLGNLAEENRKLEAAADQVESSGSLSKSGRKQIQYENWADKYQKR